MRNEFIFVFFVFLFPFLFIFVSAQNQCTLDKVEIPSYPSRVVLRYICFSGNNYNPIIPIDYGSSPREFNELDLSPNLFNQVPYDQLCTFVNLRTIDLSYNKITNITNAFKNLACLSALAYIDLSFNQISSPLVASDFNESISSFLVSINLNNNNIPSVETAVFIKSDGFSRFPYLTYLGLANNQIKEIDLLWPLSIGTLTLKVDLSSNPISKLINPSKRSFKDSIFVPMTGYRNVDLTKNDILSLDDSNLIQYGITSAVDFSVFLYKLSNYDFGRNTSDFLCNCPPVIGSYTVFWFGNFSNSIQLDLNSPIFQLYCADNPNVYIFNFTCRFVGTTSTTTTSTTTTTTTTRTTTTTTRTTTTTTTSTTTTITTTTLANINSVGALVNNPTTTTTSTTTTTTTTATTTTTNYDLLLLLLLIIPVILIYAILFLCLFGRKFSLFFYDCCSLRLCRCFNPDSVKDSKIQKKKYDLTMIYNDYDEPWLDKHFIPNLQDMKKNYKIFRIKKFPQTEAELSVEQSDGIKLTRRIVLLFTKKFIENEWTNSTLKSLLQQIAYKDPNCFIMGICVGEVTKQQLKQNLKDLQSDEDKKNILARIRSKIAAKVKYNSSLNDIEMLNFHSITFWTKLAYVLPDADEIISSVKKDTINYTKIVNPPGSALGSALDVGRKSSVVVDNELPLVTKLRKTIEARKVVPSQSESRRVEPNVDDDAFWSNLLSLNKEEFDFEPVGVAVSRGNRKSNLNRFGVPLSNKDVNQIKSGKLKMTDHCLQDSDPNIRHNNQMQGRIQVPSSMLTNYSMKNQREKSPQKESTNESGKNKKDIFEKKIKDQMSSELESSEQSLAKYNINRNINNSSDSSSEEKQEKTRTKSTINNNNQSKPKKSVIISTELNQQKIYSTSNSINENKKEVEKKNKPKVETSSDSSDEIEERKENKNRTKNEPDITNSDDSNEY